MVALLFGFGSTASADTCRFPSEVQLFGPVQLEGAYDFTVGSSFTYPNALSSFSPLVALSPGTLPVTYARFTFVAARSAALEVELIDFSGGPTDPRRIGEVIQMPASAGGNLNLASPFAVIVSVPLSQRFAELSASGQSRFLTFRVRAVSGMATVRIFSSRLELVSEIPGSQCS